MLHILDDTEITLEQILNQKFENIILYFTASWCGPCKLISPLVQELSDDPEYKDNTLFVKIDVDEFEDIMEKSDVKCMPTFHFYKNGVKKDTLEGSNKEQLKMKLSLL
tara:strand:- start:653 stop:976 length:324 start_codon:yes stop_codon:yes gene_type:complete